MSRRLIFVNVLLVGAAVLFAGYVVRELTVPPSRPAAGGRPAPAPGPTASEAQSARPPAAAYSVIAARNLFSPNRSEAPPTPPPAAAAPVAFARPTLHGVVLRDGAPIAYLEEPSTKRIAGYRLGDTIAGGSVQTIAADHVVIARPEGPFNVRLRDPSKPRPAPPPATAQGAPAQPGAQPPGQPTPGVPPRRGVQQEGEVQPPPTGAQPTAPGRRSFPPNLLRRAPQPQPAPSDGSD